MENILREEVASNEKEKKKKKEILHHESNFKRQKVTKIWLIRKMESNLNKKSRCQKKIGIEKNTL
jgi:hypothetical protein